MNQRLDAETLTIVADEFGFEVEFITTELEDSIQLEEDKEVFNITTDQEVPLFSGSAKLGNMVFIAGKEYARFDSNGKRSPYSGEVMAVDTRQGKVKVAGAAIAKKHRKAVPQMNIEGGIVELEAWVSISNVSLLDPKTKKPTRIKYEVRDGKKVRVAVSGELIPEPAHGANTRRKSSDNETVADSEK